MWTNRAFVRSGKQVRGWARNVVLTTTHLLSDSGSQEAGRGIRVLQHYSSVPFFGGIRLLVVLVNPHLRSTWRMGDRDSDYAAPAWTSTRPHGLYPSHPAFRTAYAPYRHRLIFAWPIYSVTCNVSKARKWQYLLIRQKL